LTVGDHTLNVTPPGNPGVLELTQTISLGRNARYTVLVSGDAGTLTHALLLDDTRRFADAGTVRMYNVARQFTGVDFLIVPTGTDISNLGPLATLAPVSGRGYVSIPPGTYDVYLRQAGTTTVLAGPQPITLATNGIYGIIATNGPDTSTASIALIDDF
jgi:hypothetical protein